MKQLQIMLRLLLRNALGASAVLTALVTLGAAIAERSSQAAPEPVTTSEASSFEREIEAVRVRLQSARSRAPQVSSAAQLRRAAEELRAQRLERETWGLTAAMVQYAKETDHTPERVLRWLDLPGLARNLVAEAERCASAGLWLPLGRDKAPAFFAAIARHEVSWRWRDPRVVGANGERGPFQIHPSTARMFGIAPETLATDFGASFEAARRTLERCAQKCGEAPAEVWFACYCTAGQCGGVREVVEPRFALARQLLALAQSRQ